MQTNPLSKVTVNKTLLNLINIDSTNIAFLERNNFIPSQLDQFSLVNWPVMKAAIENMKASIFNEAGELVEYHNVHETAHPTVSVIDKTADGYRCEIVLPEGMKLVRLTDAGGNWVQQFIEDGEAVVLQGKREYNEDGVQITGTDYGIQPKQIEQPDGTTKVVLTVVGSTSSSSEIGANGLISKLTSANDTVEFKYTEGVPLVTEIISSVAGTTTYEYDDRLNVTGVVTRGERTEINNLYSDGALDLIEVNNEIVFDASAFNKHSK